MELKGTTSDLVARNFSSHFFYCLPFLFIFAFYCSVIHFNVKAVVFFLNNFIYFWLHWIFIDVQGLSPVVVLRLLTVVASLVAELRLWNAGSTVVAPSLSCSKACGIFPDQESNLCPLCWQAGSFPLCYQGSPGSWFLVWVSCSGRVTLTFFNNLYFLANSAQSDIYCS